MSVLKFAIKGRQHRIDLFWRAADKDEKLMLLLVPLFNHWDYRQDKNGKMQGYPRCDDLLHWCIRNRMTGRNLVALWLQEHKRSMLEVTKFIFSQIEKNEKHALFVGKDFVSG